MHSLEKSTFTDTLSIHFDGDNSISVKQLFEHLQGIEQAYKSYLDAEYEMPDMTLQVLAVNKGSFKIVLQSVVAIAPTLLNYLPPVIDSFQILLDLIKIKKELKGKPPQSVTQENEQVKITNHLGEIHYHNCDVYNVYVNNPKIDEGLCKAFSAMTPSEKPALVMTAGNKSIEVQKNSYGEMAAPIVELISNGDEEKQLLEQRLSVDLRLRRPDFTGNTKWVFIDSDGSEINATIEDKDFLFSVQNEGTKLAANDLFHVEMRVENEVDKYLRPQKPKFYIEKVVRRQTLPKVEQQALPIGED